MANRRAASFASISSSSDVGKSSAGEAVAMIVMISRLSFGCEWFESVRSDAASAPTAGAWTAAERLRGRLLPVPVGSSSGREAAAVRVNECESSAWQGLRSSRFPPLTVRATRELSPGLPTDRTTLLSGNLSVFQSGAAGRYLPESLPKTSIETRRFANETQIDSSPAISSPIRWHCRSTLSSWTSFPCQQTSRNASRSAEN